MCTVLLLLGVNPIAIIKYIIPYIIKLLKYLTDFDEIWYWQFILKIDILFWFVSVSITHAFCEVQFRLLVVSKIAYCVKDCHMIQNFKTPLCFTFFIVVNI